MVTEAAKEIHDGELVFVGMRLPLLAFALAKNTHAPNAIGLFEVGILRDAPASDLLYTMSDTAIVTGAAWCGDTSDAMSLLADDPSIHALIAGSDHVDPAYADRLAAQITARDLAARVTLRRGSLSDAELKDTYAAADVFVIQSERYAWGLAPLEAIASGTPVILTPGAGVHDVARAAA